MLRTARCFGMQQRCSPRCAAIVSALCRVQHRSSPVLRAVFCLSDSASVFERRIGEPNAALSSVERRLLHATPLRTS